MSILARIRGWAAGLLSPRHGPVKPPARTPLERLSDRALETLEAGDYKKAEKLCRRLLREYPDALDGYDRMGELRARQERLEESLEQFTKLVKLLQEGSKDPDPGFLAYARDRRNRVLARMKQRPRSAP